MVLAAIAAVALGACGGPGVVYHTTAHITDTLALRATTVRPGQSIDGALVVHNPGPTLDLTAPGHCAPSFAAGLVGNGIDLQAPGISAACTDHPFLVGHGTTRLSLTVFTSYSSCTKDVTGVSTDQPLCEPSGAIPSLPPGAYRVVVRWSGHGSLPAPAPVTVTITG